MSRVHDMGGRHGDGPVTPVAQDSAPFDAPWHRRALAVTLACGSLGLWNLVMSRHAREKLAPRDYARFSYYEKWIAALTNLLVEKGAVTLDELRSGKSARPSPLQDKALKASAVAAVLAKGGPVDRSSDVPQLFQPGDLVRTTRAVNTQVAGGHTRLPGYAAQAPGRILRYHGTHVFPDSNAHGKGEAPEPLYAVAFEARALWSHPEHPGDEVVLDLWQSYLAPRDAP